VTADIEKLVMHAADMIRQLLSFARKGELELQSLPLNAFLKEAFKLARTAIPEDIDIRFIYPNEEFFVQGSPSQLQQVLLNQVNNARDAVASAAQPAITVALESFVADANFNLRHKSDQALFALIRVKDNGAGIPKDKVDKIFEPFFTTKGVGKGTGLGLAMVFGTVASHGGVIEVESNEGEGTEFRIYLPLSSDAEVEPEQEAVSVIAGNGETLLVVEDEAAMLSTLTEMLRSQGYRVLEACDGENAIAMFSEHVADIDIVISDVVMPVMGGVEAACTMREIRSDIPVIFMTGYDRNQSLATEQRPAGSIVISKPFTAEAISQAIHRMLHPSKTRP